MNIITLDFETYFDADYSLSKMTTEAYVRDPRFEALGCAVMHNGYGHRWLDDAEFRKVVEPTIAWDDSAVLCHHAAFDGLILSHHYGVRPARWLDTYSMAAFLFGPGQGKSLEALAARYGLAPKSVPYDTMKGKRWAGLSPAEQRSIAHGCLHDCALTWDIFNKMIKGEQ